MDDPFVGRPAGGFSIEKYVAMSRPLDLEGVEWERVRDFPVTPDLARSLTYALDIEYHTVIYMRDLLVAGADQDMDTRLFLSCWGYEEIFHGRALEKFLSHAGITLDRNRPVQVTQKVTLRERIEAWAAGLLAKYHRHFPAVYLTWGAMNEMSTLKFYQTIAKKAAHPVLEDVTSRIVKDESRHFSFYYHMAQRKLEEKGAQSLTRFILSRFWTPVGQGVKPKEEVRWMQRYVFGNDEGREAVSQIDGIVNKLPGLDNLNLLGNYCAGMGPA